MLEALLPFFEILYRTWAKYRIHVPLIKPVTKAKWWAETHLADIEWAIRIDSPFHFVMEIKRLYPILNKQGIVMPRIEPAQIGTPIYDDTWWEYQRFWLSDLRRRIKDGTFDLEGWNRQVSINDKHRHEAASRELEHYKKTRKKDKP